LRNDVVLRLLNEVPRQPTQQELDADRYLHRFVLLFDRERYSPEFFREMWEKHRIACAIELRSEYGTEKFSEAERYRRDTGVPAG
jgi:hypothetical protein